MSFTLIAGPCVVEDSHTTFMIANKVSSLADKFNLDLIFKASYKKANRTKLESFTGIGDLKALKILDMVRKELGIKVVTDVHTPIEAHYAARYVDVLQVPAFLCRQTELLIACASTGKPVVIKKGQFMTPEDMLYAVEKVVKSGNGSHVTIVERGTSFGYNDLVIDFRGIPLMQQFAPVILDVTHSLNNQPELITPIAKAGVAMGVDGIFLETHTDPALSKSDGSRMLPLDKLENLLEELI